MRFRFSLRWLFLTTVIVAACCYLLVSPTIIAQRFVGAVASADYQRADACFADPSDRFLFDLNDKHWRFHARAELHPWSIGKFAWGNRSIGLYVAYGDAGPLRSQSFTVPVTRAGMLTPILSGGSAGGMGLAHFNLRSHSSTL